MEIIEEQCKNHESIKRRFKNELKRLNQNNIDYTISKTLLKSHSLNSKNLIQFNFFYQNINEDIKYNLFIFISINYPFERPLLMMDKLSINDRKYRIHDGLEKSNIWFMHNYINQFINDTTKDDLISVKEFIEYNYKNKNEYNDNLINIYFNKYTNYSSPSYTLNDYFKIMCEGIDLALSI